MRNYQDRVTRYEGPTISCTCASQVTLVVKNLPANAEDARDISSIPGSRRSPGERNSSLLQYFCLDNPIDKEAWWATVQSVAKSQTQLSDQHANT